MNEMTDAILAMARNDFGFTVEHPVAGDDDRIRITDDVGKRFEITIRELGPK